MTPPAIDCRVTTKRPVSSNRAPAFAPATALAAGLALLALAAPTRAVGATQELGSVTGTVRISRVPPKPPATPIGKDAKVCGKEAASEALRVGPDRELADAVVVLKGVKATRAPAPTPNAAIDQVGCRYLPHVQAVTVGTSLALLNNDAVFHNVHGTVPSGKGQMTVFNLAMPLKGQKLSHVLKRPGIINVRCDAGHTWMSAFVHVVDHNYFAVTDSKGAFSIGDIPAGEYTLDVWHEPLRQGGPPLTLALPVRIAAGKSVRADAVLVP
jgi:plastocyanin